MDFLTIKMTAPARLCEPSPHFLPPTKKGTALSHCTAEKTEALGPVDLSEVRQLLRDRGRTQSRAAAQLLST